MNQSTKRILFSIMAAIFLLTACAPSAPAAATQDPALVQQLIEQSVALTVAAQSAEAAQAQAQAAAAATNTPLPTQTESVPPTPVLPTATPFVIVPPTVAPVTGGGGGSVTVKPEYACNVIDQQPADNSTWKKNKEFDINWTIVNTGTKAWSKGLDFKYYSGPQMTKVTFVEIPVAVKPGESYKVVLDAAAPDQSGFQVMTWSIEGNFCFPYVAINVE
jgi:hypothetical protein